MQYTSTRGSPLRASAAEAILAGLAPDGGLFVPVSIPRIDIESLRGKSYTDVAFAVMRAFCPDFPDDFLRGAVEGSYAENFGNKAGHMVRLRDALYVLELWHGPTAAFKDYALQLMPKLLVKARQMAGDTDETGILVATSGDTGSAALAGYAGLAGIKTAVFYPENGVSALQRLQMTTADGDNLRVYAVCGNFDDAQRGVKRIFADRALAQRLRLNGVKLSSANSINWGRLVPQAVYYITAYLRLCERGAVRFGQAVDYCVPTGNFGDIMAGWYARAAGLPVGRLICASNRNTVLADFLRTGEYNANRPFYKTSSPSMDILVSSNLERLLWHACGGERTARWMVELSEKGMYSADDAAMNELRGVFCGGWASEDDVAAEIQRTFEDCGYLCDPHTAVALRVARETAGKGGTRPCVVLSTASPYKFCGDVLRALGEEPADDPFCAMRALERKSGARVPESLSVLCEKPIRFTRVIDVGAMADAVTEMLC